MFEKTSPENSLERGGNIVDDDDDDDGDNDDDVDDDDTIKAIMEFKMSSLEFEMNEFWVNGAEGRRIEPWTCHLVGVGGISTLSACAADLASFANVVVDVVDVGESGDACKDQYRLR